MSRHSDERRKAVVAKLLPPYNLSVAEVASQQDGLLYEMELAFPGPLITEFTALLPAISDRLRATAEQTCAEQATAKRMFFKYSDTQNSQRVVQQIHAALSLKS